MLRFDPFCNAHDSYSNVVLGRVFGFGCEFDVLLLGHEDRTYPGLFRPFTVVQVDADSDGKIDEISTALCKREKMLEWLSERFPQAVCLTRKK